MINLNCQTVYILLPDGLYYISDIQDSIKYIIKTHKTLAEIALIHTLTHSCLHQ